MREESRQTLKRMVDARGRELRAIPFERLLRLDAVPENVEINGRLGRITIIVEPCSENRVRIVIQGFLDWRLLGVVIFATVALDGFYKRSDNSVWPMPDEEFYGYD
jgi:hypothetical protein